MIKMAEELGHVNLPPELLGIIEIKSNFEKDENNIPERPEDEEKFQYNKESHILKFNRLVDPVIISMFFGLYKSRKLPSELDENTLNYYTKKEFGANITTYKNIFNHFLFCLWIKENGFPESSSNLVEYRQILYDFIEQSLNDNFFVDTVIPFYLNEASIAEIGTSFLYRLKESGFVECKSSDKSPEYLSLEFQVMQEEFKNEVIMPLLKE